MRYLAQMQEIFGSLKQQVDAAVARGETLEQVRKSVNLTDWRTKFAAGSQLRAFLFDYYVTGPGVAAAFREATTDKTETLIREALRRRARAPCAVRRAPR